MVETRGSAPKFLNFEEDRYATLKLIDWFDLPLVQNAKVLVVGAGAIGNEVLKNLALVGIGNVLIYDRDKVEISNLTRSILFRESDRDQFKSEVAARSLRAINPDIKVQWRNGDVRSDLGLGTIRRMDLVIGCLDNLHARLSVNNKCYRVGRPWIDAGIGQLNGQVRVFRPPDGTCYECSFTDEDYEQVTAPCNALASQWASEGKIPTTPTMASIVGAVQVQEALKLLAYENWRGRTLVGRELAFNGTVLDVTLAKLPRRDDCPAHLTIRSSDIVELREAAAEKTTFRQLLKSIQTHLGKGATLLLNFDLAVSVTCKNCEKEKMLLKPWMRLFQEDLACPNCGQDGMLDPNDLTDRINEAYPHYEVLRDVPLAAVGIPALDILGAVASDGRELFFELTGDEAQLVSAFAN